MAEITTTTSARRDYKDVSLTFGKNPVTHDVLTVVNEDSVKRALKLLIMTRTGEAPFFPNYGSRLHTILFEPVDPITSVLIQHELRDTIQAFEPRVQIVDLSVTPTPDELGYDVNLTFAVVNQSQPVTLVLYLSRLR